MAAFLAFCIRRSGLLGAAASLVLLAAAAISGYPALAQSVTLARGAAVTVLVDQARVLKLPERTATLVIGNPLIADVTIQPGGIVVVTGKGYGTTNLVALDRTGAVTMEHPITVQGPSGQVVVLYRGIERESYSCTPNCERRITLGDSPAYFTATITQTGSLITQAAGAPK
jgi:Flp pilus assembly secretin CpaC